MPKIFKYTVVLILLFWLIGVLTLKTDGIINLFLAIGVYGGILAYTSERYWKRQLMERKPSGSEIATTESEPSLLLLPSMQRAPVPVADQLLRMVPKIGTDARQSTGNQQQAATGLLPNPQVSTGKPEANAKGEASFSRGEGMLLWLLHVCLGGLLRNAKDATFQYYGFLLHSYWTEQARAQQLAPAAIGKPEHGANDLQDAGLSRGAQRAWWQIRQQIAGPRKIMVRDGNNVVLYETSAPSAATSFVKTAQYFRIVPIAHHIQACWSPREDSSQKSLPHFMAVRARKSIPSVSDRPLRGLLGSGPQLT